MKKLLFALLICASSASFAQKTDFTGTYAINLEKTKFGAAPQGVLPKLVTAKQTKQEINISKTAVNDKVSTEILKFDGTPFTKTNEDGTKNTTTLKWADDKISFTLDKRQFNTDGGLNIGVKETWMIEDNGKTLVLRREVEQFNGVKYTITGYFDKK